MLYVTQTPHPSGQGHSQSHLDLLFHSHVSLLFCLLFHVETISFFHVFANFFLLNGRYGGFYLVEYWIIDSLNIPEFLICGAVHFLKISFNL